MRVLVVSKTTNFEMYGEELARKVATGSWLAAGYERLQRGHKEHHQSVGALRAGLKRHKIAFDEVVRGASLLDAPRYDMVLTVGGDGTLLWASHYMERGGRLAGIRSSGTSVGHLCAIGGEQIEALLERLVTGNLPMETVQRLQADVHRADSGKNERTLPVLNDILFASANPASTTRYGITIDGVTEEHKSSGVWVATPVGSTAAILAAGGTAMASDSSLFQYRVRELYRLSGDSYQLTGGYFEPEKNPLVIDNQSHDAILALDGQHGTVRLGLGDRLSFMRAAPLELARPF